MRRLAGCRRAPQAAAAVFALCLAPAAMAQSLLTGPEFQSATEGYTLYFEDENGDYFGAEQYFTNRESVWLPREGQCVPGVWSEWDERICFVHYDQVACWRIYGADGRVTSAEEADEGDAPLRLRIIRRDRSPVLCPDGPGV